MVDNTKSCVLHTTCALPWPAGVVRTKNKIQQQKQLIHVYVQSLQLENNLMTGHDSIMYKVLLNEST